MSTSSDQTSGTGSSWSGAVDSLFSYNGNVMVAAITSLLLVILFVLFLHLYAKWFLAQSRRSSLSVTHVLGLRHFDSDPDCPKSKGLDASVIAAIPLFVYSSEEHAKVHEECVVCLGGYEEGDVGRCLGTCGHAFHVECIDTWLQSHSDCPICRSPVVSGDEATASSNRSLEIVIDIIADQDRSDSESDGCDATAPSCSRSLKRMMSCKSKSEGKVHPRSEF